MTSRPSSLNEQVKFGYWKSYYQVAVLSLAVRVNCCTWELKIDKILVITLHGQTSIDGVGRIFKMKLLCS